MKALLPILFVGFVLASCNSGNVQQPEYRDIQNIRIGEVGVLQTTAIVDLIYYNPNNFGLTLNEARGDVYVDDTYLGRFSLEEKVKVGRRSEFLIPAQIKLDNIGALRNHRDIYKKKEAKVRIEGFATVSKAGIRKDVPIKYEGIQNIEKFRTLVTR